MYLLDTGSCGPAFHFCRNNLDGSMMELLIYQTCIINELKRVTFKTSSKKMASNFDNALPFNIIEIVRTTISLSSMITSNIIFRFPRTQFSLSQPMRWWWSRILRCSGEILFCKIDLYFPTDPLIMIAFSY